jgi:2-methylaconitate cis-trans-isomerase PrpF
MIPGTVAHGLARDLPEFGSEPQEVQVDIENPAGILSATVEGQQAGTETRINRPAYKRSAQILLRGYVPIYRASAALKQALGEVAASGGMIARPQ